MSPSRQPRPGVNMPGKGDGSTGRSRLWVTHETTDFGRGGLAAWPDGGGYPVGFLEWAYRTLQVSDPERVLHLCSGGVKVGVTVDIRPETNPTIVADARHVPLPAGSFEWVMIDPPYTPEYAATLYGTDYPSSQSLLKEAARLLVPGGRVGYMHFQVPTIRPPLKLERVHGITVGPGFAIRAWTVLRKDQAGMGL